MQYPNPTQPNQPGPAARRATLVFADLPIYSIQLHVMIPHHQHHHFASFVSFSIIFSLQELSTEKLPTTYLSTHRTIRADQLACQSCRKDRITTPSTAMPPLQTSEDLLICCACGTQFDISANQPLQACRICDVSC